MNIIQKKIVHRQSFTTSWTKLLSLQAWCLHNLKKDVCTSGTRNIWRFGTWTIAHKSRGTASEWRPPLRTSWSNTFPRNRSHMLVRNRQEPNPRSRAVLMGIWLQWPRVPQRHLWAFGCVSKRRVLRVPSVQTSFLKLCKHQTCTESSFVHEVVKDHRCVKHVVFFCKIFISFDFIVCDSSR